jgi:hypothetical protein
MRHQWAGQATFSTFDAFKVKPINNKFRFFAKGTQLAVYVIQFEPVVKRVMRWKLPSLSSHLGERVGDQRFVRDMANGHI